MAEVLQVDQSTLVVLMVIALGLVGFWRGVRAEGITLAGVMAATAIFTQDPMRLRLVSMINRFPRVLDMLLTSEDGTSAWSIGQLQPLGAADDRLMFYAVFYLAVVAVFYWVGFVYGGVPLMRSHRFLGGILGAINGFLASYATVIFGQDYLRRHPSPEPITITLPGPGLSPGISGGSLAQYLPLVFLAALFFIIIFTVTSTGRAKN
ncbi:MAG: hypothetical protein Q8R28_09905 [Dehalococcoidia bacterium]|nr:hypothetical protein [Dehalococcoidia bacterium]